MSRTRIGVTQARTYRIAAGLLGLMFALALVAPAAAQVQVSGETVETADPRSITFSTVVSGDPLESAFLSYRVNNPDGAVGGEVRAIVSPSGTGPLTATLVTNGSSGGTESYIPVGAQISYFWELTTRDGQVTRTEAQTFVFLDGRHEWQSSTEDGVTVYWYENRDAALLALRATADSISDMETLLQTELPYPVRVIVWPRESEGKMAQRSRGGAFDSQVITGGSRVSSDILHIYDALGSFVDVARHEAAHLVTKVAGDGTFTRVPSWLDEGTAVYAQNDPGSGYRSAVQSAVASESTLRLRNMAAPSNQAGLIDLFYGQSWAVVDYLVSEYSAENFARLYATIKAGSTTDEALTAVYGFDQDGLYNEWRESVGLPALEFASVEATSTPAASGTRAPLTLPTSVGAGQATEVAGTPAAGGADESVSTTSVAVSNTTTAIIIGVVTLLLAGGLGAVGFRLMRKNA